MFWLLSRRKKPAGTVKPPIPDYLAQPTYNRPSEKANLRTAGSIGRTSFPSLSPNVPVKWITTGQPVRAGEVTIPGGLIYFGSLSREQDFLRSSAHVIDPSLPVRAREADIAGASMPYWPHYAQITPAARLANLQWHTEGRRDPRFGIGHVFLFLYGLEHRYFIDTSCDDHDAIVQEVTALLEIYGGDSSFRGYATTFLGAARLWRGTLPPQPTVDTLQISYVGLAPDSRVALAECLNSGPLTAEWLLAWYLSHPGKSLRTPATRCFKEFKSLFVARFNAQHPEGLRVHKAASRLSVEYRSASGAFTVNLSDRFPRLSEPNSAALLEAAGGLAAVCCEALDSYSRYIGRYPHSEGSLGAQVLLPPELRTSMMANSNLQILKANFATILEKNIAQIPLSKLLSLTSISSDADARLSSSAAARLSEALAHLDIGMEPDNRFGGKLPVTSALVTIFKARNGASLEGVRPEYTAARVLVEVAVLAAGIEGNDVSAGIRAIVDEVDRLPSISQVERLRLYAYLLHLNWARPEKLSGWQRLASLPSIDRERIAHVALCALTADGRIEGPEIKFAERLYEALGIPRQRLYDDIHNQTGDEPQMVRPAEAQSGGTPIPTRPSTKSGVVQPIEPPPASDVSNMVEDILGVPKRPDTKAQSGAANGTSRPPLIVNSDLLNRTRKDTADVRIFLDDLYSVDQDDDTTQDLRPNRPTLPQRFPGLDRGYEALLDLLLSQQGCVKRVAFDAEVRKLNLLTDGALDKINDWSLDHFDESLIEDGDPLTIAPHLLIQLREMALPS